MVASTVDASGANENAEIVNIRIVDISVTRRLRTTDEDKIRDLSESIGSIGLLHAIAVGERGGKYVLLSGHHRLEAFKKLGRSCIPATVHEVDPLVEELIQVEENLMVSTLSAIDQATFIVRWEELLTQLGKRAHRGDNRWKRSGLTNADLAKSRGMSKRSYAYMKSIAKIHPDAQDLLNETEYANNKMDMVRLAKEDDAVQIAVASILATNKSKSFSRALTLGRCQVHSFDWDAEKKRIQERIGKPFSIMKWDSNTTDLSRLCMLLSHDDDTRIVNREWGTVEVQVYSQHPDHSAHVIEFYTNPGDRILDCMSGRGTNLLVGAALGRRVVGYDMNPTNLAKVRSVALEHTDIDAADLQLHHSDGCVMEELADQQDCFDLITFDPPYVQGAERYTDDPRDLCNVRNMDAFYERLRECMCNCKRLIKKSDWEKKEFHPVVMKVGSVRRLQQGLHNMSTEVELIARDLGLVLHDTFFNHLYSQYAMFQMSRCIDHRYSAKVHETNLVFMKY